MVRLLLDMQAFLVQLLEITFEQYYFNLVLQRKTIQIVDALLLNIYLHKIAS